MQKEEKNYIDYHLLENNINEYVKYYSKRILKDSDFYKEDEAYKYRAVATFQKKFDLNASDLKEMIEEAFADTKNLVQSGNYFPKGMLIKFIAIDQEYVRQELKKLIYNKDSVIYRIDNFLKNIKTKFPLKDENYYIDARFLSFILAAVDPFNYFYVKVREYKKFAEMVGYNISIKGSQGEKYQSMNNLAVITKNILEKNYYFREVHSMIVENFDYKDSSFNWGTFDFIFDVARREGEEFRFVQNKVKLNRKISENNKETQKDFLEEIFYEEDINKEIKGKTKEQLLLEAKNYHPANENYKKKKGEHKTRIENVKQKKIVKELENYVCQVCGFHFSYKNIKGEIKKYAEVDHIIDKSLGGTEELENLWVLCPNCHMKKTLGVIKIDKIKKIVTENRKIIKIRDNHLGW